MTAPLDEARLRELAEAAAPGEWGVEVGAETLWVGPLKANPIPKVGNIVVSMDYGPGYKASFYEQQNANAAFIAAANPATILALLDALLAERERGDRAVGLADYAAHDDDCTVNRYPGYEACSCGLSLILQSIRHDLATQKAEGA